MVIGRRIKSGLTALRNGSVLNFARAGRWALYFVAIGIIAGLGAIAFHYLCELGIHYFLDAAAGYRPPAPAGELRLLAPTQREFNRWILLLLPALGGLVSGWLVYTFAPEAKGPGTDATIDAFHNQDGYIRGRVPIVKTLASAITLTTGGSGGREGPIAQIGAGLASFLATKLKVSIHDRRIMMAAGIGAGVGSIFRAPLAGALFAAEVLYRDTEFESEVIIPAGISSVVAYCLFCLVFGWGSLFESPAFSFRNPLELGPYLVLALVTVAGSVIFIKLFFGAIALFQKLEKIPDALKPALGGLITGLIGFYWPHSLSIGYGFAQMAILDELAIPFLLTLALGKLLTTSFSIGSGGSGGIFGPSVVIGGALGGVVGKIFHAVMPATVTHPGSFVIVGMAGFVTAVSKTPVSTIIFVSEITNSYHLLLPSLLVCSVAYLGSRRWTIFRRQVRRKIDSPAHQGEFFVDVLESLRIQDIVHLIKKVHLIPQDMPFVEFKRYFAESSQHYFPVMDERGRLVNIFSINDVRGVLFAPDIEHLVIVKDIGTSEIITTTPGEDLNSVLRKFTAKNIDSLPVVEEQDPGRLIGMINRREVIGFYNLKVADLKAARDADAIL